MLASSFKTFFTNFTYLLNIMKIKLLTLTFRKTNGTLVIKTVRKLLKLNKNMEYGYIASAVLHLSH